MTSTKFLSLLAGSLLASVAQAQLVVANDQSSTATIWHIDVTTGAATALYSGTGAEAKAWGMAYDAGTNTLYWNNGGNLYSSPYQNPLVPTLLGALTYNSASVNYVSLSFANGKLYGTRNITTEAVYEIDVATRVGTLLYAYPTTFDFGGLEHDASTGILYGLTDAAATPLVRGLYSIDPVAQTTTFLAPYPAGETDIDGLAVANGLAYYVSDGPNTTQANFYVFDVATGLQVGTVPSPFTGSGTFSAATWVGGGGPPAPTNYCTAGTTTNGCVASISASANPSVTAANACNITVTNVEGQKSGLIFYSITGQQAGAWNATSFLCVKAPTQRTATQTSGGTVSACDGTLSLDWNAFQTANPSALGNPWSSGDTVQVQAWFRDPPAGKATNLSDAVEMTYVP
ncbi:MAG: hypothetical protein NTV21_06035 [Planctomycetota bacterium]|nr:hypothetical protein [Planctomycetota bacterium]